VRVALVLAATLLVLGAVAGLSTVAVGISSLRVTTDTTALPGGMKSLTIDAADAPLAILIKADPATSTPHADLRLLNVTGDGDYRLNVATDGSGTRVSVTSTSESLLGWHRAGEITVTLPPDEARRLSLTTQQTDGVLLVDTDLDQLTAHSTDGAVVLRGGARRVDITVTDADIVVREPIHVSESFVTNSVDGDVTIAFSLVAPRTIDAVSRDGNITIALPAAGPYLVNAQSSRSATIRVPQTNDPAKAVAQVTAKTVDGDVVVRTGR
jgi:hypothetical protein